MQTITIGTNQYGLCTMPSTPGPADIQIGMGDTVAVFSSAFNKTEQVQPWPGADGWDATITLPPMLRKTAAAWIAFLAELSGRQYVFQLGDATMQKPFGTVRGAPVVDTSSLLNNLPMTKTLITRGWAPSQFRLLMPGDHFQIGYRLHMVTKQVDSDASGAATLAIYPSLREQPADGLKMIFQSPRGLFRLAQNRRQYNWSPNRLTTLSIQAVEAR